MDIQLSFPEASQVLGLPVDNTRSLAPKGKALAPQTFRQLMEERGFEYPKKNIVFHCLKGGAAKTTLAYNTAYRLSQLGARVLLVDLDKQGNATHSFQLPRPELVFVDAVTGKCEIKDLIVPLHEHLDVLPSSLENARLEMELVNRKKNPQTFYRNLFAPVRDRYDVLILDLPPDLSHNTYMSSLFADTICIPTNPDEYSVHGTRLTLASLEGLHQEYDRLEQEILIVWTKYDAREKSAVRYLQEFQTISADDSRFPARVLPIVIRTDVTYKNAQAQNKSVFQLGRKSSAREDVDILARELVGMKGLEGA
jgi:chromosome partitioning protein